MPFGSYWTIYICGPHGIQKGNMICIVLVHMNICTQIIMLYPSAF